MACRVDEGTGLNARPGGVTTCTARKYGGVVVLKGDYGITKAKPCSLTQFGSGDAVAGHGHHPHGLCKALDAPIVDVDMVAIEVEADITQLAGPGPAAVGWGGGRGEEGRGVPST